jgi:ribulose-phosphate 3-epimerase
VDVALLMSVYPGFGGQDFIAETLKKIKDTVALREKCQGTFKIEVDGGVSFENAHSIVAAGADILVVGSHLTYGNISENLEHFWEVIRG